MADRQHLSVDRVVVGERFAGLGVRDVERHQLWSPLAADRVPGAEAVADREGAVLRELEDDPPSVCPGASITIGRPGTSGSWPP
jgi:hypothetical protein